MRQALVIQHVAFEDLGTLQSALLEAGFTIETLQAGIDDICALDALSADLLIVLGAPVGVYETADYPFLADEIRLLTQRLAAQRPTLGICLGAQLMAAALGAPVAPGKQGKEIGWAPVFPALPTPHSPEPSVLDQLFAADLRVLHWHGDTFELPPGAVHLASSARYANQAFSIGTHALALQFHPEIKLGSLERWYIGHASELAQTGVSVSQLRKDGLAYAPALQRAARFVWDSFLQRACPAATNNAINGS
ncbi:MAG TPA: glutamine amidotransferase [Steroidobacteraceae bacterium]|jgi:GMP synthase (glutamine-hydrolysing)